MSVNDSVQDCGRAFAGDRCAQDQCYMAEAMAMACGVPQRTWPNPPVGAVIVKDGRIVGRGAHLGAGHPHAEPVALAEAGDAARGATLYCTLEPCTHEGRTAPCAPAIAAAGITRVVAAMRDPNPTVSGGGLRYLLDRGVEVTCGVLAGQALDLIWPFVATDNFTHVYVELKTAVSLDGCFAPPTESRSDVGPVYLTSDESRRRVHRRRRQLDLVLVGEGTVRADRPVLDGRLAHGRADVPDREPAAGYVDTDLSWDGGFARDHYYVFTGPEGADAPGRAAIEADGGEIIVCRAVKGRIPPRSLLEACATHDLLTVMLEGGPRLAGSFLGAGLVDRWVRYTAPVVLGRGMRWPDDGQAVGQPRRDLHLTRCEQVAGDLVTVYDRKPFADTLAKVTV